MINNGQSFSILFKIQDAIHYRTYETNQLVLKKSYKIVS